MRSRKALMDKDGLDAGDNATQTAYSMRNTIFDAIPVQITELEEGCPEDYIQPGKQAVLWGARVTLLSHPVQDSGDEWTQMYRDSTGWVSTEFTNLFSRIPATRTYIVTVEAKNAEEAARKIVTEAQNLEAEDE